VTNVEQTTSWPTPGWDPQQAPSTTQTAPWSPPTEQGWGPPPPTAPHAGGPGGPGGLPPTGGPGGSGPGAKSRAWVWVAGVAALAGALIGGGVVAAVEDRTPAQPTTPSTVSRNTVPRTPGAGTLAGPPLSAKDVLNRVEPAVVTVQQRASGSNGTGMILTADGEVLTNAHVVAGRGQIQVTLFNETKPRAATLIGTDPTNDLALLKIDGAAGLPTATLGDSDAVEVGDDVVAIGNALALPGGPTVTVGIISAKDRSLQQLDGLLQTDAAINPGNSGGPLVNARGEVIGINTAVIRGSSGPGGDPEGIGFAIAANTAKPIIEELRKAGGGTIRTSGAFLGVGTVTVTPDIADRLQLGVDRGAIVQSITPSSGADRAGLLVNDVIVSIADQNVATVADVAKIIRGQKPGDKVKVDFFRDGKQQSVTAELGQR
jgi:putative serine protease PepD